MRIQIACRYNSLQHHFNSHGYCTCNLSSTVALGVLYLIDGGEQWHIHKIAKKQLLAVSCLIVIMEQLSTN